jgi:hypothetical protein
MHIHRLPSQRDHWSKDPLLGSPVADMITLWRYECIQSNLHASEPGAESLDKISGIIDYINDKSRYYYTPGTYVTIDERMISFKGNSKFVKYEPSKPTKWGFRPYVLADAYNGYTIHVELKDNLTETDEQSKMEGLVDKLMSFLPPDKHVLVTDSLYTTENLANSYFGFIGSIRRNRISIDKDLLDQPMNFRDYRFFLKDGTLLTQYADKKQVFLISNFLPLKSWKE